MFPRLLAAFSLLALPGLANAHVGSDALHGGLLGGLLHPLLGLDHLFALFAIGLWLAYQKLAIQRLVLPLSLAALVMGALVGLAGVAMPGVEAMIVLSVIAIGLLITFRQRLPAWSAGLMAGGFMLFHGVAHGAEMPAGSGALAYVLGLVLASGLVLLLSRALGNLSRRIDQPLNRLIGVALMLSGGLFAAL